MSFILSGLELLCAGTVGTPRKEEIHLPGIIKDGFTEEVRR